MVEGDNRDPPANPLAVAGVSLPITALVSLIAVVSRSVVLLGAGNPLREVLHRAIARQLPDLLSADGIAVLEIGIGQAETVRAIIESAELRVAVQRHIEDQARR